MYSNWHLLDTLPGIVIAYTAFQSPFAVWLMRTFFNNIPPEIEESALVDGASLFGTFWRISLPLVRPGLISCGIYTFIMCINEFFIALMLTGTKVKPAAVAIINFLPTGVRGTLYGQAAAAALLITIPAVIFFLFVQKYFVSGLISGAMK